eukprot:TRINITY_DN114563_c0_g1_i1.p1 TRINITY_DN114563_c0_g1~~TRINITY_DN114563_c0_g1_i1.p1  ORF type:complete len:207 (+),score=36.78 TRINITY_DN114563_c0_g1_i1:38-658(+)
MGITRASRYKRRSTGGRINIHQKKRKFELGRPAANTKLVADAKSVGVHYVRCMGGNLKQRALRLESGNFSWGSENYTSKTRVLDVVYNASNNELVRTKTLVKNAIVQIDAAPFRSYFEKKYNIFLGKRGTKNTLEENPRSKSVTKKANAAGAKVQLEQQIADLFANGRLLACITSRPGQCGRADGYVLEGKELEFYLRKLNSKKKH